MQVKFYGPQGDNPSGSQVQEEQNVLAGQATDAQVAAWKLQYRYGIYAIVVDGHIGYFKNPDRNELNCAMSKADRDKALDIFEELANLTFIGGSAELLKDDQMFIGLSQELRVKLEGKKAKLVNL